MHEWHSDSFRQRRNFSIVFRVLDILQSQGFSYTGPTVKAYSTYKDKLEPIIPIHAGIKEFNKGKRDGSYEGDVASGYRGRPCGPMDKAPDYGSGDSRF